MTQAPTASLALTPATTPAGGKDFASSVIYQVYPKSFYSSAGGVYGDLRGIIEKVPYTPARDGAPSVPGEYELVGALRPEHLAAFTSALAERYLMPISLTMEPKTLEDVFLDISGRDIR